MASWMVMATVAALFLAAGLAYRHFGPRAIGMREWVSKEPPYSSTTYKAIWAVWLWVATAFVTLVGLCAIVLIADDATRHGHTLVLPESLILGIYSYWLFGLGAFSGITTAEFYGKRKTHTPTVEAEARKEEAKAEQKKMDAIIPLASPVNIEQAGTVNAAAPLAAPALSSETLVAPGSGTPTNAPGTASGAPMARAWEPED
jgi:hypothetical protein